MEHIRTHALHIWGNLIKIHQIRKESNGSGIPTAKYSTSFIVKCGGMPQNLINNRFLSAAAAAARLAAKWRKYQISYQQQHNCLRLSVTFSDSGSDEYI